MINDELERMRDANRGRRDTPEMRLASLTGEQPSVVPPPSPRGATRSPEERMAGISPQPAPEIPPPAPEPVPPQTDDIAALKTELSNAMTALRGLMMAANDALNKAHQARDIYDDDFPEWPSVIEEGGGGGGTFNGEAYTPSGLVVEGLDDNTKPWVRYNLATNAITEETGPPASPWGSNESWRKKSDFAGAIYF